MEILPNIHSIPAGRQRSPGLYPPNVYLVMGQEALLIDSGENKKAHIQTRLDYLKEMGIRRLSYICITHRHPDHRGGAQKIKEATGAKLAVHHLDSRRLRSIDRRLEDGERLDIAGMEVEVIHTPGHTSGHVCLLLKESGAFFTGDHVLGIGTTVIRPHEGDMAQYIASLEKLLDRDIQMICPGHGPVVRSPQRKLQELIQHRWEREGQVLACLKKGQNTIEDMVKAIYPELESRLVDMAKDQIKAHLAKLEREERVALDGETYLLIGG
ncbi:MAG: MBL fold metallo-hydrolase [Dehalococcoidia bacterium]